MAISKMKLLIHQKLNIKVTCRGAFFQSSVGKEFGISQPKNGSLEKAASLKSLIKSSLKLYLIQIW